MEVRVTPDHLETSLVMTVSLWPLTDMKEVGKNLFLWLLLSNNFFLTRNVYAEKSKADDVQFILDLIAKIGAEIPEADMNNVNIAGKISMQSEENYFNISRHK